MRTPSTGSILRGLLAIAALAAPVAGQTLVIEGGTVHPVSGAPFVGRVVVDDGLIHVAGPALTAPVGAVILVRILHLPLDLPVVDFGHGDQPSCRKPPSM